MSSVTLAFNLLLLLLPKIHIVGGDEKNAFFVSNFYAIYLKLEPLFGARDGVERALVRPRRDGEREEERSHGFVCFRFAFQTFDRKIEILFVFRFAFFYFTTPLSFENKTRQFFSLS